MLDHVFVYPQAFGAVVQRAQEMTATSRTFVIDIGGYTSDVLLLRKGKPDMEFCRSLNMGVITMTNHIAGKVNSLYDISIDDEHICEILAGQNTVLDGEEAVKCGLVDELGGLSDALDYLESVIEREN